MLGYIPATQGSSGGQWKDAKCYVKTAKGNLYRYTIVKNRKYYFLNVRFLRNIIFYSDFNANRAIV